MAQNENLTSFVRDLAKFLAGATFVAPVFHKVGVDPTQLPNLVEYIFGAIGIGATIWSQVHAATHIAVPVDKLTTVEQVALQAKKAS